MLLEQKCRLQLFPIRGKNPMIQTFAPFSANCNYCTFTIFLHPLLYIIYKNIIYFSHIVLPSEAGGNWRRVLYGWWRCSSCGYLWSCWEVWSIGLYWWMPCNRILGCSWPVSNDVETHARCKIKIYHRKTAHTAQLNSSLGIHYCLE